jgi:hypothetical protein
MALTLHGCLLLLNVAQAAMPPFAAITHSQAVGQTIEIKKMRGLRRAVFAALCHNPRKAHETDNQTDRLNTRKLQRTTKFLSAKRVKKRKVS